MSVWVGTGRLLARYLSAGTRLDVLLEGAPVQFSAAERRRCRHLLYGAVRHLGLLEAALRPHVRGRSRPRLRAALLLGAFELFEDPASAPLIVHHAVGEARALTSATEARVVNAVLRRVPETLQTILAEKSGDAAALAVRFSHPAWLIERWIAQFGPDATQRLLEWNQQPAPVHARVLAPAAPAAEPWPAWMAPTRWPGFFVLQQPEWDVVERWLGAGRIYLQDPATAIAPRLLDIAPGETVLDVCAAPGGKTLQLAAATGDSGRVVALDLGGPRLARLRANLARYPQFSVTIVAADSTAFTPAELQAAGAPGAFDAVLLDAPCSNTGVLRHRVDAKWRLRPGDLVNLPKTQATMLRRAAALVRPGGKLVYSTCSLEAEENERVVEQFLAAHRETFGLEQTAFSRPWESGCDGAAAFRLRRR